MPYKILFITFLLITFAQITYAQPTFSLKLSADRVERGETFPVEIIIKTDKAIEISNIEVPVPSGFTLRQHPAMPIKIPKGDSTIRYEFQSCFFTGINTVSTRYQQPISFNIDYEVTNEQKTEQQRSTLHYNFNFVTSIYIYLAAGLIGILIAGAIKGSSTKKPGEPISTKIVSSLLIGLIGLLALYVYGNYARSLPECLIIGFSLGIIGDEKIIENLAERNPFKKRT